LIKNIFWILLCRYFYSLYLNRSLNWLYLITIFFYIWFNHKCIVKFCLPLTPLHLVNSYQLKPQIISIHNSIYLLTNRICIHFLNHRGYNMFESIQEASTMPLNWVSNCVAPPNPNQHYSLNWIFCIHPWLWWHYRV